MPEERVNLAKELLKLSREVNFFSSNKNADKVAIFTDSIFEIINNIVNNEKISDKTISALYIVISDLYPTSKNFQEKITKELFKEATYKRHYPLPLMTMDLFLTETNLVGDCPRDIDS